MTPPSAPSKMLIDSMSHIAYVPAFMHIPKITLLSLVSGLVFLSSNVRAAAGASAFKRCAGLIEKYALVSGELADHFALPLLSVTAAQKALNADQIATLLKLANAHGDDAATISNLIPTHIDLLREGGASPIDMEKAQGELENRVAELRDLKRQFDKLIPEEITPHSPHQNLYFGDSQLPIAAEHVPGHGYQLALDLNLIDARPFQVGEEYGYKLSLLEGGNHGVDSDSLFTLATGLRAMDIEEIRFNTFTSLSVPMTFRLVRPHPKLPSLETEQTYSAQVGLLRHENDTTFELIVVITPQAPAKP